MERSRRGKRHGAQVGKVSVLSGAPYGYRYISKQEGDGEARYEIVWEEARVVRQVFEWVGRDRCSIGEVSRRLQAAGERTRTGKTIWDRGTIHDMLKNPAYKGEAAFGKTVIETTTSTLESTAWAASAAQTTLLPSRCSNRAMDEHSCPCDHRC